MPSTRPNSATAALRPLRRGAKPSRAGSNDSSTRPEIWVEGRQAPPFNPMTYAKAGTLLSRVSSARALHGFSGLTATVSAFFARRDWSGLAGRLGRVGRWLPSAEGTARSFAALSECAGAAQQMLYTLPDPATAEETDAGAPAGRPLADSALRKPVKPTLVATGPAGTPVPRPGQPEPVIRTRDGVVKRPSQPEDADLSAIRALMAAERQNAEPAEPKRRRKDRHARKAMPVRPDSAGTTSSVTARLGRWSLVRLLAGGAFALSAPVGFGKALWRHLDGTDLRETIAELQQTGRKTPSI